MKKLLIIPILLFVIMSCSKSDTENNIPPSLIGKWQKTSDSGVLITNGGIIDFKSDNTFTSTILGYYPNFLGGTFTISPTNEITLIYKGSVIDPDQIRTTQILTLTVDKLALNPTDRSCFEGCVEVFSKTIVKNQSGKK